MDISVMDKNGNARPGFSVGDSKTEGRKTFLLYNGDSYTVNYTVISQDAEKQKKTILNKSATVTGDYGSASSAAVDKYNLTLTVPSSDYQVDVGILSSYFAFTSVMDKATKTAGEGNKVVYQIPVGKGQTYYYRVSKPSDNDAVTYQNWTSLSADAQIEITANDLYENIAEESTDYNADTVLNDFSANTCDVGDIYLNINEAGQLDLKTGDTYQLNPLRNWLAIESFMNAKMVQPDFHYQVIDSNGNASNVVSVSDNNLLTANESGTAIVLVTYDAVQNLGSTLGGKFFSAIWPENTGVFVVTVDANTGVDKGMTINENRNSTIVKLSGDTLDAEHDYLYYTGEEGASYSFKPESGSSISVLRSSVGSKLSFTGGYVQTGITSKDGEVTVSNLTTGRHIIKVEKDGKASYQVITAKKVSYTMTAKDSSGKEIANDEIQAGDTVTITFDRVYHPANKLSGIYNMSAAIDYIAEDGTEIKGKANQYQFASTPASQIITVTIPKYWSEDTYSLGQGSVYSGGFGSPYGSHRGLKYNKAKPANFTAISCTAYLGSLPDIKINLNSTDFSMGTLNFKDKATGEKIEGCSVKMSDASGNTVFVKADGTFKCSANTYTYEIYKAGYHYKTGTFTVNENADEVAQTIKLTASSKDAWDGVTLTEPGTEEDGTYLIETGAQLAWFADKSNGTDYRDFTNAKVKLTKDIDLGDYPWTSINSKQTTGFKGSFDGQNHSVTGLNSKVGTSYPGFIGIGTCKVSNLTVEGNIVNNAKGDVGGIVGYLQSGGAITNCKSNVNISGSSTSSNCGGIVGRSYSNTTIENCVYTGQINLPTMTKVGGIVGYAYQMASLKNNYVTGSVTAKSEVGGIAGNVNTTAIANAYQAGAVNAEDADTLGSIYGSGNPASVEAYYHEAYGNNTDEGTKVNSEAMNYSEENYTEANADDAKAMLSAMGCIPEIFLTKAQANQMNTLALLTGSKFIYVSAYDYTAVANKDENASKTGVILEDYKVAIDSELSNMENVLHAFTINKISYEEASGFVNSINGLAPTKGYSGWCVSYNNDDYANWGINTVTLASGDKIRFDYTCNYDTVTDDIGNGWYGAPYLTEFTLADAKLTLGKEDNTYVQTQDKQKSEILGEGTKENPYVLVLVVKDATDLTNQTAKFAASLNEHYCKVAGLSENQNFTKDKSFSISTLGETQNTYYTLQFKTNVEVLAEKIKALPEEAKLTLEDKNAVDVLKAEYDTFSETEKKHLSNEDSLLNLCDKLEALRVEAVIEALPKTITLADEKMVEAAEKAYQALTRNQKSKVMAEQYYCLADAIDIMAALKQDLEEFKTMIPNLVSAKATSSSQVTVTWNKLDMAQGYCVYRKAVGGKWERIAKLKGGSTLTYKDSKLSAGTKYSYTVRGYQTVNGKEVLSAYNKIGVSAVTTLASTTLVSAVASSYNSVKITWKKVTGAGGYYVYCKNGSSWKRIATINKASTVTYKDTSLATGTKYTYTVKAYKTIDSTTVYSAYNKTGVSAKPILDTVKLGKVKIAKTGLTISWSKVSGANGYIVYRKSGSSWKKLGTVTKNSTISFTDKTAKKGKTYTYTVGAYRNVNSKAVKGTYNKKGISGKMK